MTFSIAYYSNITFVFVAKLCTNNRLAAEYGDWWLYVDFIKII